MSPLVGLLTFLGLTLLLLGGVVATGYAARRRRHIALVVLAMGSLVTTIWFAEKLGTTYDLEAAGWIYPVHLCLAKTTTACYLLPLVLGPLTIRKPELLPWHRRAAYLALGLTGVSAVTGTWMLLAAEPLAR